MGIPKPPNSQFDSASVPNGIKPSSPTIFRSARPKLGRLAHVRPGKRTSGPPFVLLRRQARLLGAGRLTFRNNDDSGDRDFVSAFGDLWRRSRTLRVGYPIAVICLLWAIPPLGVLVGLVMAYQFVMLLGGSCISEKANDRRLAHLIWYLRLFFAANQARAGRPEQGVSVATEETFPVDPRWVDYNKETQFRTDYAFTVLAGDFPAVPGTKGCVVKDNLILAIERKGWVMHGCMYSFADISESQSCQMKTVATWVTSWAGEHWVGLLPVP